MIGQLQRYWKREVDFWSASTLVVGLLILIPLSTVVVGLSGAGPKWDHIASTVLSGYVTNTLVLVVVVSILSFAMAIPSAWLVSAYEFPGRKFFEWALVMPLAIPTYVAAFVYYQVIDASSPWLVVIKRDVGLEAYQFSETLLRYGLLSLLLASVLYPYLFISARASFLQQRRGVIEAARSLGRGPLSVFFTVVLPLARPALVAGLSLIIMEVINDYGAVNFFGVPTLTEGIFRTWFTLHDRSSALRLAGIVMLFMLALLLLEQRQRGRARYSEHSIDTSPIPNERLSPLKSAGAILICGVPLILGFIFPLIQLSSWAVMTFGKVLKPAFLERLSHSLLLSLFTAFLLTAIAIVFAFALKLHDGRLLRNSSRLATLGYAVPGAVVAVGVMVAFGTLDNSVLVPFSTWAGGNTWQLSGTIYAIGFAYLVRFLAVPYYPVRAGMNRICGSLDEVSRVLGRPATETLFRINLPLMRGTLLAATMLVFVDILKELPLTLILRPANFETMATTAFGLAKEGRIHECSVPSLIIILAGGCSLLILNRFMTRPPS